MPLQPWQYWLARRNLGFAAVYIGVAGGTLAVLLGFAGRREAAAFAAVVLFVLVGVLVVLDRLSRRLRRRGVAELLRQVGHRDRGPSPVPWISSETWRREQPWDAEYEFLYGPEQPEPCVDQPSLYLADTEDQSRAPRVSVDALEPKPDSGDMAMQEQRLTAAPMAPQLRVHIPSWPVCCSRLTCLVGYGRGVDEGFEDVVAQAHFLRAEVSAGWGVQSEAEVAELVARPYGKRHLDDGVALYHCRACGCTYLGSFHP